MPAMFLGKPEHLDDLPSGIVRRRQVAYLALPNQRIHGFQRFFDWDSVIGSMHVVDVEVVGLQALQAFVDRAQDRLARESLLVERVARLVEDLTGEYDLVTSALESVAEQGLRDSSVVHVGGVEEVDSGIEASADDLVRTRLVKWLSERHGS